MDRETAQWLAGLMTQVFSQVQQKGGLTVEVRDDANLWAQVIPEIDEESGKLGGVLLNFSYPYNEEPLEALRGAGLKLPPDTKAQEWEANGFARLWIRPDIPVVALCLFVGDIIEKVMDAPPEYELHAWIEYGY